MTASVIILCLCIFTTTPLAAKLNSLFFSPTETKAVAIKRHKRMIQDASCLTCTGYSYLSSTQWTIWINQTPYNQDTFVKTGLKVTGIDAKGVHITTPTGAQVHLSPGMTIDRP